MQGRERAYAAKDWCQLPERIMQAAERLRGVQIENQSVMELIPKFNYANVLIYADPPYVLRTRQGKQYRCELSEEEHEELLEILLSHKGPVLLSGYENDLYHSRLKGWYREEREVYTQAVSKRREVVWMNFEPIRQLSF